MLSSANALNLDQSKILSFGEELSSFVYFFLCHVVKPAPVADLQVNLTNISSEAIITWKSPDKLYATGMKLLYRVLLKESAQNWSQSQIYVSKSKLTIYQTKVNSIRSKIYRFCHKLTVEMKFYKTSLERFA